MVENLRCEDLINPLCVDVNSPRLSWTLSSVERGKRQRAYHVLVASSPDLLTKEAGDLWDSGRVETSQQNQVEYGGASGVSFQRHFWKVRVWDEADEPGEWSEVAEWSAGVLCADDWEGEWIARARKPLTSGPLPRFRKLFSVEKPVKRAVLYSSGMGFHEMFLNALKVGDEVLAPLWTDYRKRVFYVAHDVTEQLRQGENVIAGELGNGFYNVVGGRYVKYVGSFGSLTLRAMLRLEYQDNTVAFINTDWDWKTDTGPTVFSCIYGGEDYDARLEQPGWNDVGFDDSNWCQAGYGGRPGGELRAQTAAPLKVMETFSASPLPPQAGFPLIYDFGRNFSGWPKLRVRGSRGAVVRLQISELLDESGRLDTRSVVGIYEGPGISFSYTLKGNGTEEWHPRFTSSGFRYAEVTIDGDAEILSMEGQFVHSSTLRAGRFSSSSSLFNRIDDLVDNAVRSNMQAVLTDCPHREKLGWQEVGHLMAPSILYKYDAAVFYEKIINDTADSQLDNGLVPDICPEYTVFRGPFRDSPEWGSATVILPWMLYQWRGNLRVVETHYPTMVRYVDYLTSMADQGIVSHGLGDWCDIGPGLPGFSKLTPQGITGTAIYYQDLCLLAKMSDLLGCFDNGKRYAALAEQVREQFNERFFDREAMCYGSGSQTAQAMPLVFGMVPDEYRDGVLSRLVNDVESRGDQQTAGDVGFRYLIRALSDAGRSDVLYRMNTRTNKPSYGCMINENVTSLAEAWDANPVCSQNHCMLGHIQEWFMSGLAGINQEEGSCGFEQIVIKPVVPQGLEKVSGCYDSVRGLIKSEWSVEDETFALHVQIPVNSTARIYIPFESQLIMESGVPVASAVGVTAVDESGCCCIVSVGSGEYDFVSRSG